jgi:streptogramin lyase
MRAGQGLAAVLVVSAVAALAAALLPAGAGAKQTRQGVIEEFPTPAHVGMIAADGPRRTIWFTDVRKPAAIGRMTLRGKVRRFPLPAGVTPVDLAVAPEGSVWFTYTRGGVAALGTAEGGVGTVARNKVALYDEPTNPSGPPAEIAFSTFGRKVWFDHSGPYVPGGDGFGTIDKRGRITEYSAGLQPGARIVDMSGSSEDIWFVDDGPEQAIGRITPDGEITELGGLPPRGSSAISGLAASDSDAYFAANPSSGPAVEMIDATGQISRFADGLSPSAYALGPFLRDPAHGATWFRIERHGGLGTAASSDGQVAIGRIAAGGGRITEYSRCIRPMPAAAGIREMIRGPGDDVWYVNSPTGTPRHYRHLAMASIGRITPSGKITEFRYGLYLQSEPEDLTGAGGILWFVDGHNGRIGELVPPRGPANAAQALRLLGGKGTRPRIEVEVPGPGRLELKEVGRRPGLATSKATAPGCGPTTIPVPMRPPLVRALHRDGVVFIDGRLTFTPRGGTPLTSTVQIEVGVAG